MTFKTSATIEEQVLNRKNKNRRTSRLYKKVWLDNSIQKTYSISMCGINCFINKFYLLSTLSFLLFLCL